MSKLLARRIDRSREIQTKEFVKDYINFIRMYLYMVV